MQINKELLVKEIINIHPLYEKKAIEDMANSIINDLNEELSVILENYLETGNKEEFKYKEFTLYMIHDGIGYSYLESIILMNEYIKDNIKGKSMILARKNK